jgi:hypothetical protein
MILVLTTNVFITYFMKHNDMSSLKIKEVDFLYLVER